MATTDWDWRYPVELQDVPWDCAAASLTWALNAAGIAITEEEVVRGLGPTRISPTYGLLDASGAGIVDWLATIGVSALNDASVTWEELCAAAGHQPMLAGGRTWCHWTGIRIWGGLFDPTVSGLVALANPSPGYMGVNQALDYPTFQALGAFSAVWFTAW